MPTMIFTAEPPIPHSPGVEGHGEAVLINGHLYYYTYAGRKIPEKGLHAVKRETMFCGRRRGDVEYFMVFYYEGNLYLHGRTDQPRHASKLYAKKTQKEIYDGVVQAEELIQKLKDAVPKCKCGGDTIILEEDQNSDECYKCYMDRKKATLMENFAQQLK